MSEHDEAYAAFKHLLRAWGKGGDATFTHTEMDVFVSALNAGFGIDETNG